ncbi:MAG: YfhL family 4Fe-4S dicluster ferredoxin [Psittacicella sp.]
MALKITESCTSCDMCLPECPNDAISIDDDGIYIIDPNLCNECEGFYEKPMCQKVCPIKRCIVPLDISELNLINTMEIK